MADLPYPGMPRWVKLSMITVAIFAALAGVIVLTGFGGSHGPARHAPPDDSGAAYDSRHAAPADRPG